MCGISGLVGPNPITDRHLRALGVVDRRLCHRGPDDAGWWSAGPVALGHRRLAIVDLSDSGRQPFRSADGSVVVVFNGEIYNHEELRRRHRLTVAGRCDGAILPELWQRLGTGMFAELRGMFAIAVVDTTVDSVTLARDPFGIKPLYYTGTPDGTMMFASEPRPLVGVLAAPELDRAALRRYLAYGGLSRDQSPFAGVHSVPANGWVRWDGATRRTGGTVRDDLFDDLPRTSPAELRDAFLTSVSGHLLSDVPVALLLSSGLDSASIAWAASTLGARLTCVTVDIDGTMGEGAGAREIARSFGHRHEILSGLPDDDLADHFFASMQRPSIDGLNTFLVSRAIAGLGMKVALSGVGGDEVLAGYPHFRALRYLPCSGSPERPGYPVRWWPAGEATGAGSSATCCAAPRDGTRRAWPRWFAGSASMTRSTRSCPTRAGKQAGQRAGKRSVRRVRAARRRPSRCPSTRSRDTSAARCCPTATHTRWVARWRYACRSSTCRSPGPPSVPIPGGGSASGASPPRPATPP
ncbi:hypothetical protein GCM10027605_25030 [Micromonospora zhanjiangensis]